MILFFQSPTKTVLAVEAAHAFSPEDVEKLVWAFSEAKPLQAETLGFRKIANFGAISKIEKYIKIKNPKPYLIPKFIIFTDYQKTNMKILQILYHL